MNRGDVYWVNFKAADKSRFGGRLGRLGDDEMKQISEAVACVLDVP